MLRTRLPARRVRARQVGEHGGGAHGGAGAQPQEHRRARLQPGRHLRHLATDGALHTTILLHLILFSRYKKDATG